MDLFLLPLAIWFVMAIVVALVAMAKNRSAFGWFVYGFLVWPVALVHALLIARRPRE